MFSTKLFLCWIFYHRQQFYLACSLTVSKCLAKVQCLKEGWQTIYYSIMESFLLRGRKEWVTVYVAKYGLGKVRVKQMQPTVSPLQVYDLWVGGSKNLQGSCALLYFMWSSVTWSLQINCNSCEQIFSHSKIIALRVTSLTWTPETFIAAKLHPLRPCLPCLFPREIRSVIWYIVQHWILGWLLWVFIILCLHLTLCYRTSPLTLFCPHWPMPWSKHCQPSKLQVSQHLIHSWVCPWHSFWVASPLSTLASASWNPKLSL